MKLFSNTLTGSNSNLLKTEIMFFIASAKATEADLVKLYAEENKINTVTRILRSAKHDGIIQLFVYSSDLDKKTTEVEYLKNKYPDINEISPSESFFVLKV